MSTQRIRRTNLRPWINARVNILDGWTATAQFQYEDIYYKSDALRNADSYTMRSMYNTYTAEDKSTGRILHHIPDGGCWAPRPRRVRFILSEHRQIIPIPSWISMRSQPQPVLNFVSNMRRPTGM